MPCGQWPQACGLCGHRVYRTKKTEHAKEAYSQPHIIWFNGFVFFLGRDVGASLDLLWILKMFIFGYSRMVKYYTVVVIKTSSDCVNVCCGIHFNVHLYRLIQRSKKPSLHNLLNNWKYWIISVCYKWHKQKSPLKINCETYKSFTSSATRNIIWNFSYAFTECLNVWLIQHPLYWESALRWYLYMMHTFIVDVFNDKLSRNT